MCCQGVRFFLGLLLIIQVAVLDANQFARGVEEWRLQPMCALAVGPRSQSAPSYYAWVESTLLEEKLFCFVAQPRMLKMACVALGIERLLWHVGRWRSRFVLFYYYVGRIGQPSARVGEVLMQMAHHEVDSAAMCIASKAAIGVGASVVGQACVMIIMEGAKALVTGDAESESLGDPLYWKVAELLYCGFIEHSYLFLVILSDVAPCRYS